MDWQSIFVEPIREMLQRAGAFVPTLIGVLLILLLGWLIARLVGDLLGRALKAVQFDAIADKAGVAEMLAKGGVKATISELIGALAYWVVLLAIIVTAINALGLTVAAELLDQLVQYLPNVIVSVFLLVLGMFFAALLGAIVQTTAANTGMSRPKVLGQFVRVVVMIFATVMALEQLHIGTTAVLLAFNIMLAAIGLALALAFGLGCKEIAGRFVADLIERYRAKR